MTPAAIALTAIRDAMEATGAARPHRQARQSAVRSCCKNAEIGWTIDARSARGHRPAGGAASVDVAQRHVSRDRSDRRPGRRPHRAPSAACSATVSDRGLQGLTGKTLDQRADIRGNVTVTSRPALLPTWRLEPNLAGQVSIADASLSILGVKLSVSNEVKPLLDRAVNEQIAALQARVRSDPFLELAARREWTKMCRSIPLGAAAAGMPNLWLEMRPTRAFAGAAAHRRVRASP